MRYKVNKRHSAWLEILTTRAKRWEWR